jgi:hypothetical protein
MDRAMIQMARAGKIGHPRSVMARPDHVRQQGRQASPEVENAFKASRWRQLVGVESGAMEQLSTTDVVCRFDCSTTIDTHS